MKDLAKEADVGLGKASNAKQRLLDYEYAEEVPGQRKNKIRLTDPEKLLDDWAESYCYEDNELFNYYSLEDPREIERMPGFSCYGGPCGVLTNDLCRVKAALSR